MSKPRTSIAMCTYNGSRFISDQLESILGQTLRPFEIVICDDCSTDNTCEIVESFMDEHPGLVRLFKNSKNLGRNENFEQAIALCRGDIIALSDQDDVFVSTRLEAICSEFSDDISCGLVFSDAIVANEDLSIMSDSLFAEIWPPFSERRKRRFGQGDAFRAIIRNRPALGCSIAFRRELTDFILPIPRQFSHDAWIMLLASLFSRINIIDEKLVLYRQHGANLAGVQKGVMNKLRRRISGKTAEDLYGEIAVEHACWEALQTRVAELCESDNQKYGVSNEHARLIDAKVNYLMERKRIAENHTAFPARLWTMARLLVRGEYFIYEQGLYSLFRDMLVTFLRASRWRRGHHIE